MKSKEQVAELMIPRYKVVADYPYNPWVVGAILITEPNGELYCKENGYVASKSIVYVKDVDKYPTLFRKLYWYEERNFSDLPDFIKISDDIYRVGEWKLQRFEAGYAPDDKNIERPISLNIKWHFYKNKSIPASQEDYDKYIAESLVYDNGKVVEKPNWDKSKNFTEQVKNSFRKKNQGK